jgi:Uma2 family endonuclease
MVHSAALFSCIAALFSCIVDRTMAIASPLTISIQQLQLAPGNRVTIHDVSWDQYEAILESLGANRRIPRLNYSNSTLEIMSPLPAHERPNRLIADIVKVLLDAEDRDWEDFGSTTFKSPTQNAGLEPDTGFYIQNASRIRDRMRIDLAIDPPPDLAIEADVTSKTTLDAYQKIGVPEVWIYNDTQLKIYVLQGDRYIESATTPTFPNHNIPELIPRLLAQAFAVGSSQALRQLRKQLRGLVE